uniref:Uncharacterized protein n=1 Tax=Rhizophora mucronata TaxID=61149 RepID=A0A2P2Q073_RHIMU
MLLLFGKVLCTQMCFLGTTLNC